MPPIYFKLKYNGLTRRVAFQELPNWLDLAAKLHTLYNLPPDKVGVTYIDNDNDEITVSSNEELQDFYQASSQAGDVFKLSILDLSLPGDSPSPKRNTVGLDNFDIVEPGWHPFTLADILLSKDNISEGPHAFVEVLNSDSSHIEKDLEDLESEDGHSTVQGQFRDKGKQRVSAFGAASVASLVNEEPGEKLPIHIFDHGVVSGTSSSADPKDQADPKEQTPIQSTPKVQAQKLSEHKEPKSSATLEDPPLPTFDEHAPTNPSPNLYQDLASFLTTFSNVLSSHPELSESMRYIVNQTTSGEYWRTYSSSISGAAQRFSQNSEAEARRIEADAVRRISDVLGNLLRLFSPENTGQHASQTGGQPGQNAQSSDSAYRPYPFGFGPRFDASNPPLGPRPFRSTRGWNPPWYGSPWTRPPHWLPHPPPTRSLDPLYANVPPPPPPPSHPLGPHPPPPGPLYVNIPPPPPRRPMPSPPHHIPQVKPSVYVPSAVPPISPAAHLQSAALPRETSFSMCNDFDPPPPHGPASATEELRAKVEEAKQLYRAQKEAYRQERARRREKDKAPREEIPVGMQ